MGFTLPYKTIDKLRFVCYIHYVKQPRVCKMDYKLSEIAGTLCDILRLANGQIATASAEYYLTEKIQLLSDLLNHHCKPVKDIARIVDNVEFKQCDYIFHALFWALRDKAPFKVLNQLSDEKVVLLKDAISVVKTLGRPTDQESQTAGELGKIYCRKNNQVKNNEIQKAQNNIVRFSAFITITVSKYWDEIVAELDKWSDSVDERMSSVSLTSIKKVRQPNLPINPYKWEIERDAALAKEKSQNVAAPVVKQETKPIAAPVQQEITPAPQQKQEKQKMENEELWSVDELAKKLGYKNTYSFYTKKSLFLKAHPEFRTTFEDWFTVGNSEPKFTRKTFFKAKHFEELKAIFTARTKKSSKTAPSKKETQTAVVAQEKANQEHPTDLLGIKGLEVYLEKLKSLYAQAVENEKNLQNQLNTAKALTEKYDKKLNAVKDLLNKYEKAETDLSDAERTMKQTKDNINTFLYEASLEHVN